MVTLPFALLLILSLGSASAFYYDTAANTTLIITDDLDTSLLDAELYIKSLAVQTYLDDLASGVQAYSASNDSFGQTVQDANLALYGWIHKVIHKVKHAVVKVIKKIVDIPADVIHKITDEAKKIVCDVTHLKQTVVKRITDLKNQIKSAVTAVKKLPGKVVGQLKNALADAKNIARDVLTLHINQVKQDIADIVNKLKNTLKDVVKAELENAKKILEGDLKAALEAWALAELGPFGAALGKLLEVKQQIENYKNQLLDKLNLAKQLKDKITGALKNEIDQALKFVRDHYNVFTKQLHGQIDNALSLANKALGGVPAQIKTNVEHAIDMVGQGFTEAKARIADLEHQLQVAEGDIKAKVQADISDFVKQHGDILKRTEQQLKALKAQIETKLKVAKGDLANVLGELRDRLEARLDELQAFAKQIGANIVDKAESVFQELSRKLQDLHNTLANIKNVPANQANQVLVKLKDVSTTTGRVVATVGGQVTGHSNLLDQTLKGSAQVWKSRVVADVTNYANSRTQLSQLLHSSVADLQDQVAKVVKSGGAISGVVVAELNRQLAGAKVILKSTLTQEANYIRAKLTDIEKAITSVQADIKQQLIDAKNRLTGQLNSIITDPIMRVVDTVKHDYNSLKNLLEKVKQTLQNPLAQAKKLGAKITAQIQAQVLADLQGVQAQYEAMIKEIQTEFASSVKSAVTALNTGTAQVIKANVQSVADLSRKCVAEVQLRSNDLKQQSVGATGAIKTAIDAQTKSFQSEHATFLVQHAQLLNSVKQQATNRLNRAPNDVKPVVQDAINQLNALLTQKVK